MTDADISEAKRIKDRIRDAADKADLTQIVEEERAALVALEQRPGCAVFRTQCQNLVNYRLRIEGLK